MKQKILLLVFFSICSFFTIEAQNYVTLFSDCYYKGNDFKMNAGSYYLSQTRIGQGSLSSIKVPAGMKITLFTGAEPGYGDKKLITADLMCLVYLGWNDKAITAVVEDINNNNNNNNNNGWNNNNTGLFTLEGKNFDRNISSMYVRPGYMITVYDQAGWRGNSRTFTEDDSNLNRVGWNDKIRSFMVSRK